MSRKIEVTLVAYTRVTYTAVVEVEEGILDEDVLIALADNNGDQEYADDHAYWDQGEGNIEALHSGNADIEPAHKILRTADGDVEVENLIPKLEE